MRSLNDWVYKMSQMRYVTLFERAKDADTRPGLVVAKREDRVNLEHIPFSLISRLSLAPREGYHLYTQIMECE